MPGTLPRPYRRPVLYDPVRHEQLGGRAWSPLRVRDAIAGICRDAEAAFHPVALWPLHPADFEPGTPDVLHGLYLGAAGVLPGPSRLGGVVSPPPPGGAGRAPAHPPPQEGGAAPPPRGGPRGGAGGAPPGGGGA